MICMAVLQNCMDCVESETGSCSETCVRDDVVGTEVVWIKEEPIDVEDEIPEAMTSPSLMTEHEVRLWGMCEVVAANASYTFYCHKMKL